ncbi:hypothetical protein TL16_g03256 [Triparma laevis f. inornata]|uniref:Uncharacterized protein n=1 Tax=Triparma laevis f. inornata TaxID=1714386 RepID=A0A9W7A0V4_9STRA|nr:hypothetical protein TL16_g03256 [Triparma laevis f. inornata]
MLINLYLMNGGRAVEVENGPAPAAPSVEHLNVEVARPPPSKLARDHDLEEIVSKLDKVERDAKSLRGQVEKKKLTTGLPNRQPPLPPPPVFAKPVGKNVGVQVEVKNIAMPGKTMVKLPLFHTTTNECDKPGMDCRPLVTGCGRSGTHFMADEIMGNGIPVKHERIDEAGSVSWIYGANHVPSLRKLETWFASEEDTVLRESLNFRHFPVVHVVRHPLKAIASLTTCFCGCGSMSCGAWADEPSWEWAGKHIKFSQKYCKTYRREGLCICYGAHTKKGRLVRAIEYWIGWNEMVGDTSHYRLKMEDYSLKELSGAMGWDKYITGGGDAIKQQEFKRKSKTTNAYKLTWEEIRALDNGELEAKVWQLAQHYGYGREVPVN